MGAPPFAKAMAGRPEIQNRPFGRFFSMNFYLFLSSVAGAGSDGVDCTGVAGADSGAGVDSFANSSAANS